MPVFVSSFSQTRHAVFAIERTPPAVITPTGTGVAAYVAQFPWGPSQTLTTYASTKDMFNTLAPPGMARTGSGYLGLIRKGFPTLRVLRVTAASGTLAASVI